MEEADLKNSLVKNENGDGDVLIDKTNIMVQDSKNEEVPKTTNDVSSYCDLDCSPKDEPMSPVEDNNQECSLESELQELSGESSDDVQPAANTPNYTLRPSLKWGEEETKFMLQLYEKLIHDVGPKLKFRSKRQMWAHIATLIQSKFKISPTATQVQTRYKNVLRAKKSDKLSQTSSGDKVSADSEQDDPIGIESVKSQGQTFVVPPKPVENTQPPDPSTLLKMLPTPPDLEDEILEDEPTNNRKTRKSSQVKMFEKYMQLKCELFEKREEKMDRRFRMKIEMYKQKERLKQKREALKIEREKKQELMRQQRHLDKMKILEEILNKITSN